MYLPDDSKKYAATTTAHSKHLLQLLQQKNILHTSSSTIWENIDGCAEQYICANELYLLSILSHAHDIIINHDVVAPVYGKDVVDGINYTEKGYLSMLMTMSNL